MDLLNENINKELQRMSELAGIQKTLVNEGVCSVKTSKNIAPKEVLKEEEDIFGDIGDLLGDEEDALRSQGKSDGKLTKDLKSAMVLNNISQYDAVELELSEEYKTHTAGARPEAEGGVEGTIFTKLPAEKLPTVSKEFGDLEKYGLTPAKIKELEKAGYSKDDIFTAIEKDYKANKRSAVTWGQKGGSPQNTKWQPKPKNGSIISYETIEEGGKKLFRISKVGKEQLEFLQRMLSDRPLPESGDVDIDIESVLLGSKLPYKNLVITNAEHIIRDFFNKSVTAIISHTLRRNTKAPVDSQFILLLESGINHAIDQTKEKRYNQENYNNYGAWFMQVIKNKVIDQLKSMTDFVLDRKELEQRLFSQTTPLIVDSKLDPKEALPGKYTVSKSPFFFSLNGENKPYFRYTFEDPIDAASLFGAKAEGIEKSPLSARFLKNAGEFYKSVPKEKISSLSKTTYEPGEGSAVEQARYEGIPVGDVINIAKIEVDNILDEIAVEMLSTEVEAGEKVRIERIGELLDPSKTKNPEIFKNLDPSKEYTVIKKEPHRKGSTFVYTIVDDAGKEIKLTPRYAKPLGTVSSAGLSLGKNYKDALIETLRLMLQYGQMLPKYSKTVYFPSPTESGAWIKKDVGSNVVKTSKGDMAIPYKHIKGEEFKRFKNADEVPVTYVWDSSGKLAGNTERIIDQLSRIALEKGIELPPTLFDLETKKAKYKTDKSENTKKDTVNFMNSIRLGLRKFFGFTGEENPAIKKDRDLLNGLLKNYDKSQLAESHIRKVVRDLMTEKFNKKKELDEVSDEAQDWISNKIGFLISKEGLTQKQAAGKAYGMARQKGFKIPKK